MKKLLSKVLMTICCLSMICTGVLTGREIAKADEIADKVALIKQNNEIQRELLLDASYGDNWSYEYFGVIDLNKDGMLEAVAGDENHAAALTMVVDGEVIWLSDIWTYGSILYDDTTGNVLSYDADIDNNVSNFDIVTPDANEEWGVKTLYFAMLYDGEEEVTEEKKAEMKAKVEEYLPNRQVAPCGYAVNTENLDKYLPVDEEVIRESLGGTEEKPGDGETEEKPGDGGTEEKPDDGEGENTPENNAPGTVIPSNDKNISVTDKEGKLPVGITMTVAQIKEGQTYGNVEKLVKALKDSGQFAAYDLTLKDAQNVTLSQLNGKVAVTMPLPFELKDKSTVKVFRVDGDKLVECSSSVANKNVTFVTDHFSTYVISEILAEDTVPAKGDVSSTMVMVAFVAIGASLFLVGLNKRKNTI